MNSLESAAGFLRELLPDNEHAVQHILTIVFKPDFSSMIPPRDEIQLLIDALRKAEKAANTLKETLSDLPESSRTRIEEDAALPITAIEEISRAVSEESKLQSGWFKGTRPRGRQDTTAYHIASRVLQSMIDTNLPVTFGTPEDSNRPNTVFGRIVEEALDHHGREADWRRVAEAVFHEYRS